MIKTLHTYGDSHAAKYGGWLKININDINIKMNHIPGKLMYSFGRDKMQVVSDVNGGDMVCFCFGEIDCRCHIHKYIPDWKKTIDDMVENYFININENMKNHKNVITLVFNVVPPLERELPENLWIEKGNGLPSLGSDLDRKNYTEYMNTKLLEYCKKYGYVFLDVYDKYVNERGYISLELSDGNCHIGNPIYVQEFLIKYLNENEK